MFKMCLFAIFSLPTIKYCFVSVKYEIRNNKYELLLAHHLLSASDGEAGTADVLKVLTNQNCLHTACKYKYLFINTNPNPSILIL